MQTGLLHASGRRLRLLMVAFAISAMAALAGHAAVAHATYAEYSCGKSIFYCAAANGPEEYVPYNENFSNRAQNASGKGVCSKVWIYFGGKWHEHAVCTSTGEEITESTLSGCESCYGHGEVERWFQQYTYILYGYENS